MGSPAVHISLVFYKIALFQITNGVNSRFYLSKTLKKYHTTGLPSSVCVVGCAFIMAVSAYQISKAKAEI